MSQESDHERIRRLIQERMKQGKRPKAELPAGLPPPQHFNCRSVLPPINLAAVQAMVEQRERDAGIVPGDPNAPVSWDGLEALLGKETVDRMRAGT